ncbi:MAG: hypothetical protein LBL70_07710 [Treponema sp.]|jgi:hypothetical protein|nr:hypothetical protein [Treponema sp.]
MAKKDKAIYAPGELDRVRNKLGVTDAKEARRLAEMLGGEVGVERSPEPETAPRLRKSGGTIGGRGRPKHRIELPAGEEEQTGRKPLFSRGSDTADDPTVPVKASYFERVKMDKFCALPDFRIKSSFQVMTSILSFFNEPADLVNPYFINKRLNENYKWIEELVTSARTLFPRNNTKRNEKLKRISPPAYAILDVFRYWNIEKIAGEIGKVQNHPRNVKLAELSGLLKAVYRPIFILEQQNLETHIKETFKLLYKLLYIESPIEAKEKYQDLIRNALVAFSQIRRDVQYYLYPLLMKLLSDRWLPYDTFFIDRRRRYMAFLEATEADQLNPVSIEVQDNPAQDSGDGSEEEEGEGKEAGEEARAPEEDPDDPQVIARKEKEAAREAERKALVQGIASLEALFPKAGWERLSSFPDLYPYFQEIFSLRKGYDLIAPTDPLIQIAILMRILEELFFGLRYVNFGTVIGSNNNPVNVEGTIGRIIGTWHEYFSITFEKEYLPRLSEYCRLIEQATESQGSQYAKKILNEMCWIKRLYFMPYYKFDSFFPPPFHKKDIEAVYPEVRALRRSLAAVATGIEQANKIGGARKTVPCDGVDNPWEPYNFEVPNPVSTRLNALLAPQKRNNAVLVFFSLAIATVLDHLVNDTDSWAYGDQSGVLFRSMGNKGVVPQFGVDKKIDADRLFKESLRERQQESG